MPRCHCLATIARAALLACAVLGAGAAYADLWGYTDENGVLHLAASRVDARYQLYLRGSDVARLDAGAPALGLVPAKAQQSVPRRFGSVNYAIGYRAVRHHIREAADKLHVDYALIKAVIAAESGFNPNAVSPKGATGLMQLMPATARQYGVNPEDGTLTDARTNIFAGTRHLAYLMRLFKGDTRLVVAAYNAGHGAVKRAGGVPNYPETQAYVKTVLGLYELFQPEADKDKGLQPGSGTVSLRASTVGRRVSGRVRVELNAPAPAPQEGSAAGEEGEGAAALQLHSASVGRRASGRVQEASAPHTGK